MSNKTLPSWRHRHEPAITVSPKQYNEPVMVPGMGAQPMPAPKYVPANDNVPQERGQYIGLLRSVVDRRSCEVATTADLVGINYADDESEPVVPVLSEEDWQRHASETDFAFHQDTQPARYGDFMQTATGRKFWPLDPRRDEVFIEDIAHSLSLQCRYAGHCLRFYSVAEHSVLMARKLRWEGVDVALWALLHDASEAYLVDVPRPVKPYLTGYKEAEARVMAAVADRYSLAREMPAEVHEADERIIADELVNLVPMDWHGKHNNPLGVELRYWSPEKAEEEFMATFDALLDGRKRGMSA
ncbi:hypothetical protein [Rhizobium esperanzae]|uniref:Phosphohydrolase n=1 Tax=Rhizobium esperanzae TaxID=1967781 RepID=A0A7W6R216_9HYPH|nr:hypothetical protein [Rhizobium esperanzae]MBB4235015.1 hypothetical protein [Rhizobium esperanzae]